MKIDQFEYQKLDFRVYTQRINALLKDSRLINLGITKNCIGHTAYGYEISEFVIGNGMKDLYIVGGTHGSEILGVDFVTQLMYHVPHLKDYDPNLITLHFIPLQNPEGFDITTQALNNLSIPEFQGSAYEYYLRYKLDDLINQYFIDINQLLIKRNRHVLNINMLVDVLRESFKMDSWIYIKKVVKNVTDFEACLLNIRDISDLYALRDKLIKHKNNTSMLLATLVISRILDVILDCLYVSNNKYQLLNLNCGFRLYQHQFADSGFGSPQKELLLRNVKSAFSDLNIPRGSHIKFDPNGEFINLNKNNPNNPGPRYIHSGIKVYGGSPANNILDYDIGPIGKSTKNLDSFSFAAENCALERLLNNSATQKRLSGILLYHSTGGIIYSTPTIDTKCFVEYNKKLSEVYCEKSNYADINKAENTGYGDYLRNKYPGVLMIELSKMGGNPIGPYGDINNIYRVMLDNTNAFNNVIKECNATIVGKGRH